MTVLTHFLRLGVVLSMASSAEAATYVATLSGGAQVPPNASTATGTGRIYVTPDGNRLAVRTDFTGLSAPLAAAHVHCCAAATGNGPVAVDFTVPSATAGTVTGSFDLTDPMTYAGGFFNGPGGGTLDSARAALLAGLAGGGAYLNLHNSLFPGGEIRGQLAAAVPEPASWAMLITGFALIGATLRSRRPAAVRIG